jgi:hypothetical protein
MMTSAALDERIAGLSLAAAISHLFHAGDKSKKTNRESLA